MRRCVWLIKNKYSNSSVQVKASFWYLLCNLMQKSIAIISTPIFTRLMNADEYGQYNVFVSWLSFAIALFSFNIFGSYFISGLVKNEEKIDEFTSSLNGLLLILLVIWGGVYWAFADFWKNLLGINTAQSIALFILVWTQEVYNCWTAVRRVRFDYKPIVLFTVSMSLLRTIVCVSLVLLCKDKATGRILGWAVCEFLFCTALFISQLLKCNKLFSSLFWKKTLVNCIPLVPHYLAGSILINADRIMIEEYVGNSEVGIYSLAYSLSMLVLIFCNSLHQTLEPYINDKIKNRKLKDVTAIVKLVTISVGAVDIIFILVAPELVRIFAPIEYYDAIWCIPPICLSTYFIFLYGLFAIFEFFFEKSKYTTYATGAAGAFNIILNALMIPKLGYYSAAYTTLFSYILLAVLHYYFMTKICKKELKSNTPYPILFICMFSVILVLMNLFIVMLLYGNIIYRYIFLVVVLLFAFLFIKKNYKFISIR